SGNKADTLVENLEVDALVVTMVESETKTRFRRHRELQRAGVHHNRHQLPESFVLAVLHVGLNIPRAYSTACLPCQQRCKGPFAWLGGCQGQQEPDQEESACHINRV